jgi:hypothetical protein
MFEKEIKFIVDYTLNKLRKESAHISMGRLLNSSIHPAIVKYCTAEIDNQIRKDRERMLHESFFDYSGSEISKYLNMIAEEIRKNYKMKGEDLKKLIIKAVSFNANYVVRPGWTMAKFIFNEEKEKTVKDVLKYFNYVFYYDYQIQVLSAFISKRKIDTLSQDEFIMITSKIDKEVLSSNRKEVLRDGVSSIAEFYNEGGINKDKVAPYLIEYYLKDKKFTDAAEILRRAYPTEDKQKQSVRDIVSRLSEGLKVEIELPEQKEETSEYQSIPEVTYQEPELEPESTYQPPEPEKDQDVRIVPVSQENDDYQFTLKDLLKKSEELRVNTGEYNSNDENPSETQQDDDLPAEDVEETETPERVETDFSFKYYVKEEKPDPEDTTIQSIGMYNLHQNNDIFNFLSKKEIDRIVETVFNEDQDEFASTMDKITECKSYDQAALILKKTFQTFKVNPYSKDAIMLTTAVANYFNQG